MLDLVGNLEDMFSIMIFQMSPEEKNSLMEKLAAAGNMNASTVDTKEYFKVTMEPGHEKTVFVYMQKNTNKCTEQLCYRTG